MSLKEIFYEQHFSTKYTLQSVKQYRVSRVDNLTYTYNLGSVLTKIQCRILHENYQ